MTMPQPQGLISVLLDPTARVDERDDAAMDLSDYPGPETEAALLQAATNPAEDEMIRASAGESLAWIWIEVGRFDSETFAKLSGVARREAESLVRAKHPEWLRDDTSTAA